MENYYNPLPVARDGKGKKCAEYSNQDWFEKIQEEVLEAHYCAAKLDIYPQMQKDALAEELTDIITVCTSYLHALGYNETMRGVIQDRVNIKNKARGYFDDV